MLDCPPFLAGLSMSDRTIDHDDLDKHLSQISTSWTVLFRAHREPGDDAAEARAAIIERDGKAIYRYLLGATRDRDRADELFQEFALKLVRGDFRNADPRRGRFREFMKTSLYHLIVDDQKRRRPLPLTTDMAAPVVPPSPSLEDEVFLKIWREELLHGTWTALEHQERRDGRPLFTVLPFHTDCPELNSQQAAQALTERLGRPLSAEWVRKWIHRARKQFATYLCDEVARSLGDATTDQIEQELQTLGWLDNCRDSLHDRRRES
jgi:DNA-directed RNA polymerase specialized sigma24 family protein